MRASLLLFALSACATTAPPTLMNSGPEWMRTGQDVPDLAPTHVVSPMGFTEDGITRSLAAKVAMTRSSTTRNLVWSDFRDGVESVSFSSAPLADQ